MSRDTIRARAAAATEGPWTERGRDSYHDQRLAEGRNPGDSIGLGCDVEGPPEAWHRGQFDRHADAAFIAHARQDIPAMLAVADAAAEMLDEVMCHATSGGTEGKWCIEHDVPMTGANQCFTSDRWRAALAALEALP